MRALKAVASSAVIIFGATSAAAYCDSFPAVEQEFKTSAIVFVGKVTSAKEVPSPFHPRHILLSESCTDAKRQPI